MPTANRTSTSSLETSVAAAEPRCARARPRPAFRPPTSTLLSDVALIDGPACAAAACISLSLWHELVRTGKAPQPVIRRPRCTRWRIADVRAWLIECSASGTHSVSAQRVMAQANKASRKAAEKRAACAAK